MAVPVQNSRNGIKEQGKARQLYKAVWRWHFYACMIFSPFIIILALTGAIYLFKPQIESVLYKDKYYVEIQNDQLSPSRQLEIVKKSYPNAKFISYKPASEANRTTEVGILNYDESMIVFVNPYNGQITGALKDKDRLMNQIELLHGELMAGTVGDRLVELAACWTLILVTTGLYLWWPRNRKGILGTLLLRLVKERRTFWRDSHAVTGFWLSMFIVFLILTGLPWSGFWGEQVKKIGLATNTGYPLEVFKDKPESKIPSKNFVEVPWAAEKLPVPKSKIGGVRPLSIDKVIQIIETRNVHPGYSVYFPEGSKGVYTVSVFPDQAVDEATLHIDQYSGNVLGDYRFKDYGFLGKAISTGITLHEGTHFGLLNQIIGLIVCLGIVVIVFTGIIMWWRRKPQGKLGAPSLPKDFKVMRWVTIIIIAFSVLFPLVGISLIVAFLMDFLIIKRMPKVKQWVGK